MDTFEMWWAGGIVVGLVAVAVKAVRVLSGWHKDIWSE